jgi:hypothetical protein
MTKLPKQPGDLEQINQTRSPKNVTRVAKKSLFIRSHSEFSPMKRVLILADCCRRSSLGESGFIRKSCAKWRGQYNRLRSQSCGPPGNRALTPRLQFCTTPQPNSTSTIFTRKRRCDASADQPCLAGSLFRCEFAEPVGGGDAAVHEDVAAGDKASVGPHEERSDSSHLVRRAAASDCG